MEGLACTCCVYKASKEISKIPGVRSESVNIDLKAGVLSVRSKTAIDKKKIIAMVKKSGFSLSDFKETTSFLSQNYKKSPILSVKINSVDIKQYKAILEKIGTIAASGSAKLVIHAPISIEITLLKPLIAGRQQVARVQFIESKSDSIQLDIYQKLKL